jgi:hypothetical protein
MLRRSCSSIALALAGLLAIAATASAASFTVNDLGDAGDAAIDGVCDTVAGAPETCTIRAALEEADGNAEADQIDFAVPGVVTLTGGQLISGAGGLTINGNGSTLDANGASRVLAFGFSAEATTLNDLEITGGTVTDDSGAGISSGATTLTLNRVRVTGNEIDLTAGGEGGAGIRTAATSDELVLNESTVSGNTITGAAGTSGFGAGIQANGPATINRSTLSGNKANETQGGGGGGARLGGSGSPSYTIVNSTISDNQAGSGDGGGLRGEASATLTILNSTIAGNSSADAGGGISSNASNTFRNTIVAKNSAAGFGQDCALGAAPSSDHSIDSSDPGCTFSAGSANLTGVPAAMLALGNLANNGGPTQTRSLAAGSVAIGTGDNATCAASPVDGTDQRGVARPQGAICDVGSFERLPPQAPPPPAPQPPLAAPIQTGGADPGCATLRHKLKKVKGHSRKAAKKRKALRRKLRRRGC